MTNYGEILYRKSTELAGRWIPAESLFEHEEKPGSLPVTPPLPDGQCKRGHAYTVETTFYFRPTPDVEGSWRCKTCQVETLKVTNEKRRQKRLAAREGVAS